METTNQTALLDVTPRAIERALALLGAQAAAGQPLRVFAQDGGCSGYQFGMAIADAPAERDLVLETGGLTLIVDPESAPLLQGAQIDFVDDVMRSGFTITNPNVAATSCRCGAGGEGHGGEFPGRCC
ncbi:MAG: HesB/IscA family protein [Dehalococcoidia bacterium]